MKLKNVDPVAIVGAGKERREHDFYPTPPEVTNALLDFLNIPRGTTIWEPACGDMAMCEVFIERGYDCIATDLIYGQDFLTAQLPQGVSWIITNPPFSLSEQFIKHAAALGVPFAFLLKSQYWHSIRRFPLLEKYRPAYMLPLTWRPDFTGKGNSLMDMQWDVWLPISNNHTTIYQPLSKRKE